jgi:hypothetical protein
VLGFEGVAEVCFEFLPGYREGQAWKEVVDYCYCKMVVLASTCLDAITCWDDLSFSESA